MDDDVTLKTEFPELDGEGKDYATAITENIVEKLHVALGIPADYTTHEQLKSFFAKKFKPKVIAEFKYPFDDKTDREMLSAQVFGHMQEE